MTRLMWKLFFGGFVVGIILVCLSMMFFVSNFGETATSRRRVI